MPYFNDIYLHNYKVLDYGLICKNNPEWGLVLVVSGSDAHPNHLSCLFSCHSDMFIKYGTLGSFFCVKSCIVLYLHHPHPFLLFFCPINLGIVIVRNAEGQPKEQGGCYHPHHLKKRPGQPHRKEWIEVIIVPPALPPIVPSAPTRKKRRRGRRPLLWLHLRPHPMMH
jgi:hypothetical protein